MIRPVKIAPPELQQLSRFVDEAWRRWPDSPAPDQPVPVPSIDNVMAAPETVLRRYRQLASTHILWRDLAGQADIETTGRSISALARQCIELALIAATRRVENDFGELRDDNGKPIRLAVLGLGKLGGDELNFNSDIDVVFIYRGSGHSNGRRALDAASYLKRVAVQLIQILDSVTADGRVWVVDTRLRPFGNAGALVWSLGAIEQYFLNEARTWERYAWLKAAPVAGDQASAQALLTAIHPFIFRRYLDYGIFESLRKLHDQIDAKSRQDSRHDDIKRGVGGIRELEFLVQSLQILRGGRYPALQTQGFFPALRALAQADLLDEQKARELGEAYGFLRILENRLQAMNGRQSHHLPDRQDEQDRLVELMGQSDWDALIAESDRHRHIVQKQFRAYFRARPAVDVKATALWPPGDDLEQRLRQAGIAGSETLAELLHALEKRISDRALSAEGRGRLERLMPSLLAEVTGYKDPETGLADLLQLIDQISRRSAYLALLHERPATLKRLVQVFRQSPRLAAWIVASPQLLDDLLDPVHCRQLPTPPEADQKDPEATLFALGRWRQAGFLRTALAEMDGTLDAVQAADQISRVASVCIDKILELTAPASAPLAVIAYGNLGAGLLHFDSDLDLVFLHGEGAAPLRSAQRFISYMQIPLPGGRLFEIDTRLRPNGNAGTLVSSIDHFSNYQSTQAMHWEHQALIRARWVAGDLAVQSRFEHTRAAVLTTERREDTVRHELGEMRQRQQLERPETPVKRLLTDLQFIAECGLLCRAHQLPELIHARRPDRLLALLGQCDWMRPAMAEQLSAIWQRLLSHRHQQWLGRDEDVAALDDLRDQVHQAWARFFDPSP